MSTITIQVICTVCGEKYNYDNGHRCKNGYAEPRLFSLDEANAMVIRQLKAEIKKWTTFTPEPGALADLKAQAEKSPSSRAAMAAYINGLEWELRRTAEELDMLKKGGW